MHIGVIIPAHNEAKNIGKVLHELAEQHGQDKLTVIVVDDGSRDNTSEAARKEGKKLQNLKVLQHKINLGKGAAAKTGCDAAYRLNLDAFVLMDGDGQHKPSDIWRMIDALKAESPSLVIGTRSRSGQMPFMMRFGNAVLTGLVRLLFSVRVKDTQSGFRAFTREAYPKLRWRASNYSMESEMLVLAATNHISIKEVPIATVYLDHYKGTTPLDGLRVAQMMVTRRIIGTRRYETFEELSLKQL